MAAHHLRVLMNDVQRKLRDRNALLESLSDVGVALAGSFDIQAILTTTRRAAVEILETDGVSVVYFGSETINARPRWAPEDPSAVGCDEALQRRLIDARGEDLEDARTTALPIAYQDEKLGAFVLTPARPLSPETSRLVSILGLQAATALRNIHLTQERIQFERLSAVGRLIGTVVHDFRSPLTALRGYAGMLASLELEENEVRRYGRYAVEECERLNHMVEELLEFTRGGRIPLSIETVDVGEYLTSFAERLRAHADGRWQVEVDAAYSAAARLDGLRMERALWNVATNACQAMQQGGRVLLRSDCEDGCLVLSVRDEGVGIPEELRHRIFEPFFSHGKAEGIGLGMMIARKIVEEHGGTIEVDSATGRGTTVRFLLPLQSLEPEPEPRESLVKSFS